MVGDLDMPRWNNLNCGFQKGHENFPAKNAESKFNQLEALKLGRCKGRIPSEELRKKISKTLKGRRNSIKTEFKKGHIPWLKGKKMSKKTIEKMSKIFKEKFSNPKNHPRWKGGITLTSKRIRNSLQMKIWRKNIFERDKYICQSCGVKGTYLHADHILLFSKILDKLRNKVGLDKLYKKAMNYEDLWDINNGRTLCKSCHYKRHKEWTGL